MRSGIRILGSVILLAGLFGVTSPALAMDRGEMRLAPFQNVTRAFPAITAMKPEAPVTAFYQVRPAGCRAENGTYCDAVNFFFDVPATYRGIYNVKFTLAWDPGTSGNDLQLWIWQEDEDPTSGAPFAGCDGVKADANRQDGSARPGKPPKSCTLGEPAERIAATVVNIKGVNTGYTLTMTWQEQDLGIDRYLKTPTKGGATTQKPPPSTGGGSTATTVQDEAAFSGRLDTSAPKRPEPQVPGADGELRTVALPTLEAGVDSEASRLAAEKRNSGLDPVTAGIAGLLLASGAGAGFVAIRRRRATDLLG